MIGNKTIHLLNMEDSDSDSERPQRVMDFEAMALAGMSAATIELLKQHLQATNESNNNDEQPQQPQQLDTNAKFKTKEYWEDRFETEEVYDWLATFKDIDPVLRQFIKPEDKILVLGCGNSTFSADLYDGGFKNIINIDFSENVIDNMKKIHSEKRPEMEWVVMDMTDLTFEDGFFDVVIDKAAMDALMVDEGDVWYPQQSVIDIVDKMCYSVSRVLKSRTGIHIQVSFAQPHFRTKYLTGNRATNTVTDMYSPDVGESTRYNWELLPHQIIEREAGCLNCFAYIMKKH